MPVNLNRKEMEVEKGMKVSKDLKEYILDELEARLKELRKEKAREYNQKYGKELNPYTLIYMLLAVILPSLGVTFLMILSTFTGLKTSNSLFYGILPFLIIFQYFFINFIRSKRPLIKS